MDAYKLSLQELESFDSASLRSGDNWRFLCPFCGTGKPRDDAHRSLSYNPGNGLWNCKRCSARGKEIGHWEVRPKSNSLQDAFGLSAPIPTQERKAVQRPTSLQEAFGMSLPVQAPKVAGKADSGESKPFSVADVPGLKDLRRLWGTEGAEYIKKRGLELDLPMLSDVQFAPEMYGNWGAIVFPITNENREMIGVDTRSISGTAKGQRGTKKGGIFESVGALAADALTITEAPFDALSLCACGVPAVALCGKTGLPDWVLNHAKEKVINVAFDSDAPGNEAAESLIRELAAKGFHAERLVPPEPFKDWNEALQELGRDALESHLTGKPLQT